MALVESDLFLVQDATTKTNYKVTLGSLATTVADEISYDNIYVNDSGDNMTGDLTLGPTGTVKITLSASTGDGNFTGTLYANYLRVANTLTGTGGLTIYGDTSSTKGLTINSDGSIDIDGDLSVDGDVVANSFTGDGSGLTNLNVPTGVWQRSGDDLSPTIPGNNIIDVTDITIGGNLVATGTLEAASIDGGTYT